MMSPVFLKALFSTKRCSASRVRTVQRRLLMAGHTKMHFSFGELFRYKLVAISLPSLCGVSCRAKIFDKVPQTDSKISIAVGNDVEVCLRNREHTAATKSK